MNAINAKIMPACYRHLATEIQELLIPEVMRTRACDLLANIQHAKNHKDLDRSSTFASGFILGIDLDHVRNADLLCLQEIFCTAYETRRDQFSVI